MKRAMFDGPCYRCRKRIHRGDEIRRVAHTDPRIRAPFVTICGRCALEADGQQQLPVEHAS